MLLGMHGKKQAGKDTAYRRLAALFEGGDLAFYSAAIENVRRVSFADLLYRSAAAALGVTVEQLNEWKTDPSVGVAVVSIHDEFHELCPEGIGYLGDPITVREYLQRYGTEAHRNVFGTDFWVDAVDLSHEGELIVVTDVRFPNEAEAIRKAGGRVVRIVGPPEVENTGDAHASEIPLPAQLVDHTVRNDIRYDRARYEAELGDARTRSFKELDRQLRLIVGEDNRVRACRTAYDLWPDGAPT